MKLLMRPGRSAQDDGRADRALARAGGDRDVSADARRARAPDRDASRPWRLALRVNEKT